MTIAEIWGTIYTKLLPLRVSGDPTAPLVSKIIEQPSSE
jgi:hypothetical protein